MDNEFSEQNTSVNISEMEDNLNYQNNGIVLSDSSDLDWAQIVYAVNYKRLIFSNCTKTWSSFYCENGYKYADYTPEELRHRFLQRVLPNIYEYELTENELYLLNLLDLHPNFERTSVGFKIVEQTENLTFPLNEAAIQNLITPIGFEGETNFIGTDVISNRQIVIGSRKQNSGANKFNLCAENAALLSVTLCSDENLPNCELLTNEEICKRLKSAKHQYENKGEQLQNINIPLENLLKKIEKITNLKNAVAKLVNKSLRGENDKKLVL